MKYLILLLAFFSSCASASPKILTVGDSMMHYFSIGLSERLKNFDIVDISRSSTGLTRPDFYDWEKAAVEGIFKNNPEFLVVHLGANDAQALKIDGKTIQFGSKEWDDAYKVKVKTFVYKIKEASPDLNIIWVFMPSMRDLSLNDKVVKVSNLQKIICNFSNVSCYDSREVIGYDYFLGLRADDGVHYKKFAGTVLAEYIAENQGWK